MIDVIAAEEMIGNALAWVCLRGAGVLFAALALLWFCKVVGAPITVFWRRLTPVGRTAACAMLLVGIIYGGSKTNGPPLRVIAPVAVSPEDIARGYRVECVTTNAEPFAEMPSGSVEYARWSLRGGRETWFPLDLVGFVFPLGSNRVSRLRVLSGGMVETFPSPNGVGGICAAREVASLVPGVSRFWSADDGGAKVLRWDGVFAERDLAVGYDAAIRLFADGDFTTRSNEVETVFRRVNPDDWDGDGLANGKDANPTVCDGDFFGAANALPEDANPAAYYWLDLVVDGAAGVATIRVTCDGQSDLGDHVIIARTNQVCHVPLLAGATYAVESDLPIDYSDVSSEHAEIVTNAPTSLTVRLPVELSIERVQTRGGSDSYIVRTSPVDVGPRVVDVSGGCCSCVTNENGFSWVCFDNCHCDGEHWLSSVASWEGYSKVFNLWGWCPCHWQGGGSQQISRPNVGLSVRSVLFDNSSAGVLQSVDLADVFVSFDMDGTSTNGSLRLTASGRIFLGYSGPADVVTDGSLTNILFRNCQTPFNAVVKAGCFNGPSDGYEDMELKLEWVEGSAEDDKMVVRRITSVAPDMQPISNEDIDGEMYNPCAILGNGGMGFVKIDVIPASFPDTRIVWQTMGGAQVAFPNGSTGRVVRVCGGSTGQSTLSVQIGDAEATRPSLPLYVVDESVIDAKIRIVTGPDGGTCSESRVVDLVHEANAILKQAGIRLASQVELFSHPEFKRLSVSNVQSPGFEHVTNLVQYSASDNILYCYVIEQFFESGMGGCELGNVVAVCASASGVLLAHEIGHALGLEDIYTEQSGIDEFGTNAVVSVTGLVSEERVPLDWCGGDTERYYPVGTTQREVVDRLLMRGDKPLTGGGRDISAGDVFGVWKKTGWIESLNDFVEFWEDSLAPVGIMVHGNRALKTSTNNTGVGND